MSPRFLKRRKISSFIFPLAAVVAFAATELARSQDIRSADVSHDVVNKINLGLFSWKQDSDGNMIASFVMSNYGERNIREVTIGCDYMVNTVSGPRKIQRTLKDDDLATRLAGENFMRAGTGRHYADINFGPIDSAKAVRYMMCQISNAKF